MINTPPVLTPLFLTDRRGRMKRRMMNKKIIAIVVVALFIGVVIPSVSAGYATEKAGNTSSTPSPSTPSPIFKYKEFRVTVENENHNLVEGAEVRFDIYFSRWLPFIGWTFWKYTDENGVCDGVWSRVGIKMKITATHPDYGTASITYIVKVQDKSPIEITLTLS
jgi:hypothetical protein